MKKLVIKSSDVKAKAQISEPSLSKLEKLKALLAQDESIESAFEKIKTKRP